MFKSVIVLMIVVALVCVMQQSSVQADTMAAFEVGINLLDDIRLGDTVEVVISNLSGSESFSSFIFLVSYDSRELEYISATEGDVLVNCGWEYFQESHHVGAGGDTNLVEINAVADLAGGDHPSCHSDFGELVVLKFKATTDTAYVGDLLGVNFYWQDCESNTLLSAAEDTIWFAKFVYDQYGNNKTGEHPTLGGTLPGCIVPGETVPIRGTNYISGGINMSSELGLYGDVNDDRKFNISDITYMIAYIFDFGPPPLDYLQGDFDGDGFVTISDAVFLLDYLFAF